MGLKNTKFADLRMWTGYSYDGCNQRVTSENTKIIDTLFFFILPISLYFINSKIKPFQTILLYNNQRPLCVPLRNTHDLLLLFVLCTDERELLIYSSDVEIIFPSNLYIHFVSTSECDDQSNPILPTLDRIHAFEFIAGATTEIAMLEWNVFHTSIIFFFDRTKNSETTVCFFYPDHAINLNPFTVQNALHSPLDIFL